jgi:hypothetical protein
VIATIARLRVPLGFVFGAAVLWLAEPTATTLSLGMAIAAGGESLRVWASGHLNKGREVTMSGPYRWVAHPLYVGSSLIGAGLAVASNSRAVAALITLYLLVTITAAVRTEEAHLRRQFGTRYDEYRTKGSVEATAVGRRFRLRQAIANREHRALAGLLAAGLLLALKATYNGAFWRAAGRP